MKKITNHISKDMLITKSNLLKRIQELSGIFTQETMDTLIKLVMLEESVIKQNKLEEYFEGLNLFFDIAKFNICNKTILTIDDIDQNNFQAIFNGNEMRINYVFEDEDILNVFKCDFTRKMSFKNEIVRPYINIFYSNKTSEMITNEDYLYKKSISDIERIKEQIEICNEVTSALIDDWNIEFDEHNIKTLAWVDIYKRRKF